MCRASRTGTIDKTKGGCGGTGRHSRGVTVGRFMAAEKIVHGQWRVKPCSLHELSDIEAGAGVNCLREHVLEAIRKAILVALRK